MTKQQKIICIGSVLWDVIGKSDVEMQIGTDIGGRIQRLPGGVALNVAMALAREGLPPALLSSVGQDGEGHELIARLNEMGLLTKFIYRPSHLPTDVYMAIEGANGVIAAIADAHSLELAGNAILTPLFDGQLGTEESPFDGIAVLDGNLTEALLEDIAHKPIFSEMDLRIAPASPGKVLRLKHFLQHPNAVLYVNKVEADLMLNSVFDDAFDAARALVENGAARVFVTNGANAAVDACPDQTFCATPPKVEANRLTGAGDTFIAAQIAAELSGMPRKLALEKAVEAAATYVKGENK